MNSDALRKALLESMNDAELGLLFEAIGKKLGLSTNQNDHARRYEGTRVYVAHNMSGGPGEYLANCAAMAQTTRELMQKGLNPYNPAGDMLVGLTSGEPLDVKLYKRVSMAQLETQDFVLVDQHGPFNQGVLDEVDHAQELGIPVVYSRGELYGRLLGDDGGEIADNRHELYAGVLARAAQAVEGE